METSSIQEKFNCAVQLIKNLPKSGNFEPSNDMKLRFYSFFKQATEGPCNTPRPIFLDFVGKAKWDAWNRLGEMAREDAMQHYVTEFVEIIKNSPFDEKAHDLVDLMGPFIELAPKEFKEKYSKQNGKIHDDKTDYNENQKNGHVNGASESDFEDFSDTFDQANEDFSDDEDGYVLNPTISSVKQSIIEARGGGEQRPGRPGDSHFSNLGSGNRGQNDPPLARGSDSAPNQYPSGHPSGSSGGGRRNNQNKQEPSPDVSEQLAFAVIRLQHTMDQVVNRLDSLEALLQERRSPISFKASTVRSTFLSVFGIPFHTAFLILIWPFLTHWVLHVMRMKRRK